jgi:hypothetical protein
MTSFHLSNPESRTAAALEATRSVYLQIEGASPEETSRGLAAAQAVFEKAGVTAGKAYWAICELESADDLGWVDKVPSEAIEYMHVWEEAERAAIEACCAGWQSNRPERYVLHLFPKAEAALS